jgi:hypothetical protein
MAGKTIKDSHHAFATRNSKGDAAEAITDCGCDFVLAGVTFLSVLVVAAMTLWSSDPRPPECRSG